MPLMIPTVSANYGRIRHRLMTQDQWNANSSNNGGKLFPGQIGIISNGGGTGLSYLRVGQYSSTNTPTVMSNALKIVPEDNTVTNSMLANMPSYTVKVRDGSTDDDPSDISAENFTERFISRFGPSDTPRNGVTPKITHVRGLVDIQSGTDPTWIGESFTTGGATFSGDYVLRRDGKWARQVRIPGSGVAISSSVNSSTDTITLTPTLSGSSISFTLTHPEKYSSSKLSGSIPVNLVATDSIQGSAVTSGKIASGAVTEDKISNSFIKSGLNETGVDKGSIFNQGTSNPSGTSLFYFKLDDHTLHVNTTYGTSTGTWVAVVGVWG